MAMQDTIPGTSVVWWSCAFRSKMQERERKGRGMRFGKMQEAGGELVFWFLRRIFRNSALY
jgi:hypothetical protein